MKTLKLASIVLLLFAASWYLLPIKESPGNIQGQQCGAALTEPAWYQLAFSLDYASRLEALYPDRKLSWQGSQQQSLVGSFYLLLSPVSATDDYQRLSAKVVQFQQYDVASVDSSRLETVPRILELQFNRDCTLVLHGSSLINSGDKLDKFLARFFLLLDFYLPASYQDEWSHQHSDASGDYLASYQWLEPSSSQSTLSRQREKYLNVRVNEGAADYAVDIIESKLTATKDKGVFWFSSVQGVEDISILKQGSAVLQSRIAFTLVKLPANFVLPEPVGGKTDTAADPSAQREDNPVIMDNQSALELYLKLIAEGKNSEALDMMVSYLREQPAFSFYLQQQLLDGSLDRIAAPMAFLALGKAGTEEAGSVLVEIFQEQNLVPQMRARAAFALAVIDPPSINTVAVLSSQLDTASTDSDFSSQSALLAIGQLMDRIDDDDDAVKRMARNVIDQQLDVNGQPQELRSALAAAYNSRDSALFPAVIANIDNPDPSVRAHVAMTAAKLDPAQARDQLYGLVKTERSPVVQAQAIESLGQSLSTIGASASTDEINSISVALSTSNAKAVKNEAIVFLGQQSSSELAREALLKQVRVERDPKLLRKLGTVLSADDLRELNR